MNSRMEKYETSASKPSTRTLKNKNLYEEVDRIDVGYIDINDVNVFEINKGNKIKTREDYKKAKEFDGLIELPETKKTNIAIKEKEERIYDINEILAKAKQELKEETTKKRLLNTEYNILTKLDIENIEKISNEKELKEEEIKNIVEQVYPKKEQTNNDHDLFEDLKDDVVKEKNQISKQPINDDVDTKKPVVENEIKGIIDTTSVDQDFVKLEKSNKAVVTLIVIISILFIGGITYLLLKYFKII